MTQYIHTVTFDFSTGGSIGLVTDDPVLTGEDIKKRLQDPAFLETVLSEIDVEVSDQTSLYVGNIRESWKRSVKAGKAEIDVDETCVYEGP